ncbi:MAG: DUF2802 domain-containing protein [Gammaproteobacteria bacterium]|nr:DUF2802 domain-containing protein [Gammaproteobacteria bacterium]
MMIDPVIGILSSLVIVLSVGQIYQLVVIRRLRAQLRSREDQTLRQRDDFAAMCKASVGAGDHLVRLEQQVRRLTERQDQIEMRSSGDRPYTQAIQMVQHGADVTELIANCGLTRGEAELIAMLHGVAKAS